MTDWFSTSETGLADLQIITGKVFEDKRGEFARLYCDDELSSIGEIRQINRSLTRNAGDIRGLHFQNRPFAETKLIRCIRGEVWDVAVDLRKDSPSFLQWHAEVLTSANRKCMVIPEGFAHGFQALTQDCELLYLHTERYVPESEGGLRYDDPSLGINWPMKVKTVSERDAQFLWIDEGFEGLG